MCTKQNLKVAISANIVALRADGQLADTDLTIKEFLQYMQGLTEDDCNELETFSVTFLHVPWLNKSSAGNIEVAASDQN